jgi:hypothetical protein
LLSAIGYLEKSHAIVFVRIIELIRVPCHTVLRDP